MKNKITAAVAVYLILQRQDGDFLMMLRQNTGYQDDMWQTPAGHLEDQELPIDALIRESKEEIGVLIEREDVKLVHISARPRHDDTGNRIDMFFRVLHWTGEPVIMEPDKCKELRWCSLGHIPINTTPHVRESLICAKQGPLYYEFSLNWIKAQPEYGLK